MTPFKYTFKDDSINRMVYGTEPPPRQELGIEDAEILGDEGQDIYECEAYSPNG